MKTAPGKDNRSLQGQKPRYDLPAGSPAIPSQVPRRPAGVGRPPEIQPMRLGGQGAGQFAAAARKLAGGVPVAGQPPASAAAQKYAGQQQSFTPAPVQEDPQQATQGGTPAQKPGVPQPGGPSQPSQAIDYWSQGQGDGGQASPQGQAPVSGQGQSGAWESSAWQQNEQAKKGLPGAEWQNPSQGFWDEAKAKTDALDPLNAAKQWQDQFGSDSYGLSPDAMAGKFDAMDMDAARQSAAAKSAAAAQWAARGRGGSGAAVTAMGSAEGQIQAANTIAKSEAMIQNERLGIEQKLQELGMALDWAKSQNRLDLVEEIQRAQLKMEQSSFVLDIAMNAPEKMMALFGADGIDSDDWKQFQADLTAAASSGDPEKIMNVLGFVTSVNGRLYYNLQKGKAPAGPVPFPVDQ